MYNTFYLHVINVKKKKKYKNLDTSSFQDYMKRIRNKKPELLYRNIRVKYTLESLQLLNYNIFDLSVFLFNHICTFRFMNK